MIELEPLEVNAKENTIAPSIGIKIIEVGKEKDRLKIFSHIRILDKIIEEKKELIQPQDRLINKE